MASAPRRRNGRPQACQPCSRRKVACDHRLPVCSRCQRSRCADQCVYLPERRFGAVAPLTPPSAPPSAPPSSGAPPRNDPETSPPAVLEPLARLESEWGYLGATNFSAVFKEARGSLGDLHDPTSMSAGSADLLRGLRGPPRIAPNQAVQDTAVDILRYIPNRALSYTLFRRANLNNGWCELGVSRLLDSFWATFGPHLEHGEPKDLLDVAETLSRNTARNWTENQTDPGEWFGAFSGDNFRWESLGALFIYWASGTARSSPDSDEQTHMRRLYEQRRGCAWSCTELSRRENSCNTVVLWVLFRYCITESALSGDGSMRTWRIHSDVAAFTTYMGLHISPEPLDDRSISVQVKRRMYVAVYKMDKVFAIFAGRPPLMIRKYSTTPLPLDMSDEELLGDVPTLPKHFDAAGWNTHGKILTITGTRARGMLAIVAESILEIALQQSDEDPTAKLLALKEQAMVVKASFPPCLLFELGNAKRETTNPRQLYYQIIVSLEHLQNLFIIERLLHRQGHPESALHLLEVSFEMVSQTLEFWKSHTLFVHMQGDLEWLATQFAATGGGILCVELLQPRAAQSRSMTRSDIVQKLGLLAEFLDGIESDAPNGTMCGSVKKIVRHVLDKALNGDTGAWPDATGGDAMIANWDLDLNQTMDVNDIFNFDFLDTFNMKYQF